MHVGVTNCRLTDFVGCEVRGELSRRVGLDLERLSSTARRARDHLDRAAPHVLLAEVHRRQLRHVHPHAAFTGRRPAQSRHSDAGLSQRPLLNVDDCSTDLCLLQPDVTRGQSNLTKSAHSPVRGHPRGSKFVPLNSWGMGSY